MPRQYRIIHLANVPSKSTKLSEIPRKFKIIAVQPRRP